MIRNVITATQVAVAVMLSSAAAFALSFVHPFGNPRTVQQPRTMLLQNAHIPESAKQVLITKCADCHSDATQWRWYAQVAPASWLIESDVVRGRAKLDLSHWTDFSADRQQTLATEIAKQASRRTMPPTQYNLIHWQARLTPTDIQALLQLDLTGPPEASTQSAGNAIQGKALFERRCTGCHTLDNDREGPRLRGVFGRKAASVHGFSYSNALSASAITWNQQTLDKWLADPDTFVPQNAMDASLPKAQQRLDVIAYLQSLR